MLPHWPQPPERALLLDTIAQLGAATPDESAEASELYRDLYDQAPTSTYADAFHRLTGRRLPAAPALPPLAAVATDTPVDLDALLTRVEQLARASNQATVATTH